MKRIFLFGVTFFLSGQAIAESQEDAKAKFSLQQSALVYSQVTTKMDGAKASTTKTTTTHTGDLSLKGEFSGFGLYIYPFNTSMFGVSYKVMPSLEVGLNLTFNQQTTSPDKGFKTDENGVGLFAIYEMPIGKNALEFTFNAESSRKDNKQPVAQEPLQKVVSTSFGLGANYVLPLSQGINYVAGVKVGQSSETESKTKATGFEVQLAAFRFEW